MRVEPLNAMRGARKSTLNQRLVATWLTIAALLVTGTVLANTAIVVLLVRTPGDELIVARAQAELVALGFRVELLDSTPAMDSQSLRQLALGAGAKAALRATPSTTGIELWIGKGETTETLVEEVVSLDSGKRNDQLLALRATEVLRARLVQPIATTPPARVEPPAPPAPAPEEPRREHLAAVGAGVAALAHPGQLPLAMHAEAALRILPNGPLSAIATVLWPLQGVVAESESGSAEVEARMGSLGGELNFAVRPLLLSAGASAGFSHLSYVGSAQAPLLGRSGSTTVGTLLLHAGASLALGSQLRLRGGGGIGWSAPRVIVTILDRPEAVWGRPLVWGSVCVELLLYDLQPRHASPNVGAL